VIHSIFTEIHAAMDNMVHNIDSITLLI